MPSWHHQVTFYPEEAIVSNPSARGSPHYHKRQAGARSLDLSQKTPQLWMPDCPHPAWGGSRVRAARLRGSRPGRPPATGSLTSPGRSQNRRSAISRQLHLHRTHLHCTERSAVQVAYTAVGAVQVSATYGSGERHARIIVLPACPPVAAAKAGRRGHAPPGSPKVRVRLPASSGHRRVTSWRAS
jgi:hypothetical protein